MTKHFSQTEIEGVFMAMDLPLIERSIEEIRDAKERFSAPTRVSEREGLVQRLVVSNGTGRTQKDQDHAELERRSR